MIVALPGLFSYLFFSPASKAHCLELCILMMKSMPGLPKLVHHMTYYVEVFGIEVELDDIKLKINRSVVLPTRLYTCEY